MLGQLENLWSIQSYYQLINHINYIVSHQSRQLNIYNHPVIHSIASSISHIISLSYYPADHSDSLSVSHLASFSLSQSISQIFKVVSNTTTESVGHFFYSPTQQVSQFVSYIRTFFLSLSLSFFQHSFYYLAIPSHFILSHEYLSEMRQFRSLLQESRM